MSEQEMKFEELFCKFATKKRGQKELEATVPGQSSCLIEIDIPSSFCYYPQIRKRAEELRMQKDFVSGLQLLEGLEQFFKTGEPPKSLTGALNAQTAAVVVDLIDTDDENDAHTALHDDEGESKHPLAGTAKRQRTSAPEPMGQWQVDLGSEGWMDLNPNVNAFVEASFRQYMASPALPPAGSSPAATARAAAVVAALRAARAPGSRSVAAWGQVDFEAHDGGGMGPFYRIDFRSMLQTNLFTANVRPVRRNLP